MPEPGAERPGLDERQAQLAYNHFTDGSLLFSMGDYEAAAEAFERALRYDPASYEIRLSLAESYFRLRQFTRAIAVAKAIVPKDAEVYDLLGRTYGYLGQNEDARTAYLDLLQYDSTDTQAYWFLSRLAMRRGNLEEATNHLSHLARYRPASRIYNELGDLYIRMGRPDDAIATYRRSLVQDSTEANRGAFLGLAGALEAAGRIDEAAARYRYVIAASPEDLTTRRRLVHLYLSHNELDSAIAQVEEILAREPSDADRVRLGLLLYDTEQYDRAESLFVQIAAVDGEESYLGVF
ncbi:MAG TPA: tetratricopeptide repeat protein, partial [Acidobacteriota bacterium]|nr:tetratricopeptide repeat protein [Acidobacteriota bacterium]